MINKYEIPKLINLKDERVVAGSCNSGSGNADAACGYGGLASGSCGSGAGNTAPACNTGNTASNPCQTGSGNSA
jgi:hypothetical protein